MIEAAQFIEPARSAGFSTWAGVPCSFLTPFINGVIADDQLQYIGAANEGDAVAIATGAALAGHRSVAMMQNSGLGNAVSPLSSLNWVFRIPVLLIITLRGETGRGDEPQHELMGRITTGILDQLDIPWTYFPGSGGDIERALAEATGHMDQSGLPYAFVMRKGTVAPTPLESVWEPPRSPVSIGGDIVTGVDETFTRCAALEAIRGHADRQHSILVGSTGYAGRELFALGDRSDQLYMVGSMGCAASLGLGLSLTHRDRNIYVADGDGAALMRLGNLATVGAYGRENFHHVVLDNGMHESTGGQPTVSRTVDFAALAAGCGYTNSHRAKTAEQLASQLGQFSGPVLYHARIRPGVIPDLPRPDVSPIEVKRRLMAELGAQAPWATI